jgi:hypothetical protein
MMDELFAMQIDIPGPFSSRFHTQAQRLAICELL